MSKASYYDLGINYTGGGSNSVTTLSIGGAISSARIRFATASALTTLSGVTIEDSLGSKPGAGTLSYDSSTGLMTWAGFGQAATEEPVDVSTSGGYFIQSASSGGGLCVLVNSSALPTSGVVSNSVTIANTTEKWFLNQTALETDAGVNKYHCFAIKNYHATNTIYGIKLWVATNTPGQDDMSLFLDPLAASDGSVGPTAVANENTAPAASTFVKPTSVSHADVLSVGNLAASEVRFFWVLQTTPAGITEERLASKGKANTFELGMFGKFS